MKIRIPEWSHMFPEPGLPSKREPPVNLDADWADLKASEILQHPDFPKQLHAWRDPANAKIFIAQALREERKATEERCAAALEDWLTSNAEKLACKYIGDACVDLGAAISKAEGWKEIAKGQPT